MFAYFKGTIANLEPTHAVIDVMGVGYELKISLSTFASLKGNTEALLWSYQHVTENALTLYGFAQSAEKKRFLDLISISGVGPNTALMILSSLSSDEILQAILNEKVNVLQSVKGVGLKTAQRIILELRDKMKKEGVLDKNAVTQFSQDNTVKKEALNALITLGYSKAIAEKSLDDILKLNPQGIKVEDLIKEALKRA